MSFTQPEPATPRLTRSELAVPGVNPALFDKAAKSAAFFITVVQRPKNFRAFSVEIRASSSALTPNTPAAKSAVCRRNAGSFGLPRCGIGVR